MEHQEQQKYLSRNYIILTYKTTRCHRVDIMHFTVFTVLLMISVWPVLSKPVNYFCENTARQIESILNSLQSLRITPKTTPLNQTKIRGDKSLLNTDQCELVQRLTNYQECTFEQSPKISENIKKETNGLVNNLQSSVTAGCVPSDAVCPYSHLSLWTKINVLVGCWSQDVVLCKSMLESLCSSYNSV